MGNGSNLENYYCDVKEILMESLPYEDFTNFRTEPKSKQVNSDDKKNQLNLSQTYHLNVELLFSEILSTKCTSINFNHCFWLKPETLSQVIAKTQLKEIHLVECQVDESVIDDLLGLNLKSLSISWTQDWFRYALKNEENVKKGFASIKKLEMLYSFQIQFYLSWILLRNCCNLEELKLYETGIVLSGITFSSDSNVDGKSYPGNESTPVPKLRKLTLDMRNTPRRFLKTILKDKVIPIEELYLGQQTIKLISLQNTNTQWRNLHFANPSTFCLSGENLGINFETGAKQSFWETTKTVQTWLKQNNYQKFEMENLMFDDLWPIALNIVMRSKNSVKAINFNGSIVGLNMLNGIKMIAQNCYKLSFLDMSFQNWNENNETLMQTLSSLSNLEALYLPPSALGVAQSSALDIPTFSLKKVTIGCPKLRDIRIVGPKPIGNSKSEHREKPYVINQNTLADITYCENLEELHLVDFVIAGPEKALPMIAERCAKLKALYVNSLEIQQDDKMLYFVETLNNAFSLKYLSFQMNLQLTVPFVNALCNCSALEKIHINPSVGNVWDANAYIILADNNLDENIYFHLANGLPNLRRLRFFYMRNLTCDKLKPWLLESSLIKIAVARPSFFYHIENSERRLSRIQQERPTPVSHLHMRQYEMYTGR